jgi:hypothetical protein
MWQQFLMKAMEGGNKTANTAFQTSSRDPKVQNQQPLGGTAQQVNQMGLKAMGSESKDEDQQMNSDGSGSWGGGADGGFGHGSDARMKQETPNTTDMIAEVAESINNYKYHYKPGVGEDPSVEYSGPMAQELLQVDGYRSCVIEGEDGLLKVDTGRLALVNAGLISDLSKRLLMLETFVQTVMDGLVQGQYEGQMSDVE